MRIAIIGAGNMGGAIARALAKCDSLRDATIICTAKTQTTLDRLHSQQPRLQLTLDNREAATDGEGSDFGKNKKYFPE